MILNHEDQFEDIKEVIRICKSKKDRQQRKKRQREQNNDIQNTSQKTKDRATRTILNAGGELRCSGRASSSCSTRVTLVTSPMTKS